MNNTVVKIEMSGNRYNAYDIDGNKYTSEIGTSTRKGAYKAGMALERRIGKNDRVYWWKVPMDNFESLSVPIFDVPSVDVPSDHAEVMNFIHDSYKLKPVGLVMKELKWKYLVRGAVRGKNILMTGPAGCGKTMAAKSLVNALDRPDFYFNLGATQDPRSTLIGNTHFEKSKGTYFSESLFVKAISTPDAVILLDELSRAHPDAWNILMTVLDEGQRYLRLDEADGNETVAAWVIALEQSSPTAILLTRQGLPQITLPEVARVGVSKGGYVLLDSENANFDVLLIASGSEVSLLIAAGELLTNEGITFRIVSMPSWELFDLQSDDYRNYVLPPDFAAKLAVEAGIGQGWERFVGDHGELHVMSDFGASGPGKVVMEKFGFTAEAVADHAQKLVRKLRSGI